jgi:hypothetical protein
MALQATVRVIDESLSLLASQSPQQPQPQQQQPQPQQQQALGGAAARGALRVQERRASRDLVGFGSSFQADAVTAITSELLASQQECSLLGEENVRLKALLSGSCNRFLIAQGRGPTAGEQALQAAVAELEALAERQGEVWAAQSPRRGTGSSSPVGAVMTTPRSLSSVQGGLSSAQGGPSSAPVSTLSGRRGRGGLEEELALERKRNALLLEKYTQLYELSTQLGGGSLAAW